MYGDLYYGDDRPLPAKAFDRSGNVMLCSSFTKTVAPGFRLGWVSPGRWHAQVQMAKFINSVGCPEILQLVVADFLASGGYDRQLRTLRRVFRDQVSHISTAIPQHFPPGTRITRPAGGYHPLGGTAGRAATPRNCSGRRCATRFRSAPGTLFSATDRYRNCMRMGCAEPWSPRIEQAVAKLGELLRKQLWPDPSRFPAWPSYHIRRRPRARVPVDRTFAAVLRLTPRARCDARTIPEHSEERGHPMKKFLMSRLDFTAMLLIGGNGAK